MKFRKDINAVRAYAILGVILYHFDFTFVNGGFAGVDVFFVISGFLMASIIMQRLDKGEFNLIDFYLARCRRIIPPLLVLCFVISVFGFFYLSPPDYEQLKRHLVSSIGFYSNYIYWLESGYFSSASKEKWLLHTWSLSVEWQFYIILPLCLVVLYKIFNKKTLLTLSTIFVLIGYVTSIYASSKFPSPNFFFLPTRFWELLIGLCLYFLASEYWKVKNERIECYIFYLGVGLIFITYIAFDSTTPWPGFYTFLPILATCLIILANNQTSSLVNLSPIQFLGKISYSLYLWHWPIAVLMYYLELNTIYFKLLGLLFSVLLGYLSYELVEKKISAILLLTTREVKFIFISVCTTLIIVVYYSDNIILYNEDEISTFNKIESSPERQRCHTGGLEYLDPKLACKFNNQEVQWAVIGDSHGVELSYSLASTLSQVGEGLVQYTFSGCIPSYERKNDFSVCSKWTNQVVKDILGNDSIKNVVVIYRYKSAFNDDKIYANLGREESENKKMNVSESFYKMVSTISHSGRKVFVISPFPDSKIGVSSRISASNIYGGDYKNISVQKRNDFYLENSDFFDFIYPEISKFDNVKFVDVSDIFCDENVCYAIKSGIPLFFDDDHPSISATDMVADLISKS